MNFINYVIIGLLLSVSTDVTAMYSRLRKTTDLSVIAQRSVSNVRESDDAAKIYLHNARTISLVKKRFNALIGQSRRDDLFSLNIERRLWKYDASMYARVYSPLYFAVLASENCKSQEPLVENFIKSLLKDGTNPNTPEENDGTTSFMRFVQCGFASNWGPGAHDCWLKTVESFLAHGADIGRRNKEGLGIFDVAARNTQGPDFKDLMFAIYCYHSDDPQQNPIMLYGNPLPKDFVLFAPDSKQTVTALNDIRKFQRVENTSWFQGLPPDALDTVRDCVFVNSEQQKALEKEQKIARKEKAEREKRAQEQEEQEKRAQAQQRATKARQQVLSLDSDDEEPA